MFDPLGTEAFRDDYDSSLHIEAQSHLSTALFVLSPNGHEHLILQHGRGFQIDPKPETGENILIWDFII